MSTVDKIQIVSFRYPGESRWRQIECKPPAGATVTPVPVFDKEDPDCQIKRYEVSNPYTLADIGRSDCKQYNPVSGTLAPRLFYGWVEVDRTDYPVTYSPVCPDAYTYTHLRITGLDAFGRVQVINRAFGNYRRAALQVETVIAPLDPPSDCYKNHCRFDVTEDGGTNVFSRTTEFCPEFNVGPLDCPDGYLTCAACCYSCSDLAGEFRAMLSKVKPLNGKTVSL